MSLSIFEMHSVELRCQRPPGACYVICDEWLYKACLRKAADVEKAKANTREFLDIAGLNRTVWERDKNLLRSLTKCHWLTFHRVRERNPDTDGWWIIGALLSEVRRGSLLAVKGRRADLFPPDDYTPLPSLGPRTVSLPNSPQPRLIAARAAMGSGSSDSDLADDVGTLTQLGNAQPFEYIPDTVSDATEEIAGIGSRSDMYACDIISAECKGSVLREFPGQYLNSTLRDIESDAQDGVKDARKALKLLNDGRFKK